MKPRTLKRHINESFKSLARNGWMTFASVSAVTVSLVLVGLFLMVMFNLNKIAGDIENDVQVRVYIDQSATGTQQNQLKSNLKQVKNVQSVTFQSKQQGLNNLLQSMGSDKSTFQDLQKQNPLPNVFILKTSRPEQTVQVAQEVRSLPYVSDVRYGKGTVEKMFQFVSIARNVGIVLIIGLLFTSVFLIANTIKLTIVARRREIEIMKLVGATNAFVRWPYFIEGLIMGILGSIIPVILVMIVYHFAYYNLGGSLSQMFIRLIPYQTMTSNLSLLLIGIGAAIGVWGSLNSVRKFLKV
ncbi:MULTISPECIES: permease-like cell division protein FtsX [unclassified Sporolactobacillus]|uniref:permease-like cell division protein FtsX n=1 Tax=unclassified Sporolactobacillus TaxID=2628533 RepID=UPI002368F1EB|nr:permease-like cell division protein FtsX [Sporolactobacillus sp. CQH2019]MDD9148081.1 permease-like cell division protein FtsX [Sporolactobacillus sp. CQH2019]